MAARIVPESGAPRDHQLRVFVLERDPRPGTELDSMSYLRTLGV